MREFDTRQVAIMKRLYLKTKIWLSRKRNNFILIIVALLVTMFIWLDGFSSQEISRVKGVDLGIDLAAISSINIGNSSLLANNTYAQRKLQALKVCMSKKGIPWPPNYSKVPRLKDSPLISKKYKLTFCPAGKVASSFFTRYMMVMESNGTLTSPYDIPIAEAGRERVSSLKSLNKSGNMLSFLQSSTKVVFGRDPYSRILSAYIDKMFSPNPFYWKHWGERTLKMLRIDKTKGRCASNVTFAQFLVYALNDLRKTDVHLMPVSTLCNMCGIVYDVVGKLETVREDLDYLSRKHNISSAFQYAKDYKLSASNDVLYDSVTSAFAWKSDIKRCIGLDEMGLRIWRKLQLRGIIDSRISYPFKSGELENMTAETFISFCQEAIKASTDSAQLKKQKVRVFMEAYGSVRNVLLQKISANYGDDFDMFGYDPTPDMFENLNQFKEPRFLQWDKHWLV